MNSKKTFSPLASGIIWEPAPDQPLDIAHDVDLTPGEIIEPEDGKVPIGFHPDTHEAMYLEESTPSMELTALPEVP